MNAQRLLVQLEHAGVILAPRGDRLHVDAPKGVITEEVRQQMVEHKPELMRLLRDAPEESEPRTESERVAGMKLDDFARAGLIVQVRSQILGADVLFVSDNVPEAKLRDRSEVVYRAHELKKLARVPPDPMGLRTVHMVKEIYGGTIENVREKDDAAEG